MRKILAVLSVFMPWPLRRWFMQVFLGYDIHPTSRIGLSYIAAGKLVMEENSRIGNFNVCKGMSLLHLKQHARIAKGNWIYAFPAGSEIHFAHETERKPELVMGPHSAITSRHIIDCTNSVSMGSHTTIAGYGSQILTHSIDLQASRQASSPITIGCYCFVGTGVIILGGSSLPDYSVLGAGSLLNKNFTEPYCLNGGIPARCIKKLPNNLGYFKRGKGVVE